MLRKPPRLLPALAVSVPARFAVCVLLLLAALPAGVLTMPSVPGAAQSERLKDASYVSPTWGYVVRWYSDEWTVSQEEPISGAENLDTLVLTDSLGNSLLFGGWPGFGGDAETCLDATVASAQQDPSIIAFTLAADEYGNPYEARTPEQAYAAYLVRTQGEDGQEYEIVLYTECQTLAPGDAVFSRTYTGPPEVFEQWYDDIVDTLEAVYLPPSAWLPINADGDLSTVWAGLAPLDDGAARLNAAYIFDAAGAPQLLVGLADEAAATRVVSFENVSEASVAVTPSDVTLELIDLWGDEIGQEWPLLAARWEDGTAGGPGEPRLLAPGERATILLDFATGDLSAFGCDTFPSLSLGYPSGDGTVREIAESALPAPLADCIIDTIPPAAAGRPVFAPASTVQPPDPAGVTRETLLSDIDGQLDAFGRIPLARYTVDPGATVPEALLTGPLAAVVEAGTFEMVYGESVIEVNEGADLAAPENSTLSLRNTGDATGALLVLSLAPSDPFGAPVETNPAPGVTAAPLLGEQNLAERFAAQQFTLDRATLAPGASLMLDADDGSAPEYTAVLIERGSVTVLDPALPDWSATPLAAGESRRVPAGTTITATPDQEAAVLLVEVRAAQPASGAAAEATPLPSTTEQATPTPSDEALDTLYTNPAWSYLVHWDPAEWTLAKEPAEDGSGMLTLGDDAGNTVAFLGRSGYGGDATACLESMKASAWEIPGATDYVLGVDEFGEPAELRGPAQAYAFYQMSIPDAAGALETTYFYDECQTLVAGEAVFQRSFWGPAAAYADHQPAIAAAVEGAFLPASAWLAHMAPPREYGYAGLALLRGLYATRNNATLVPDAAGEPQFLAGLLDEAGDTRRVLFENVSDEPVLVEPEQITLTLASRAHDLPEEELPLLSVAWEDGEAATADGSRTLAPGERVLARLTFAAPQSEIALCDDLSYTTIKYPWLTAAEEERGFFGYGELPTCPEEDPTTVPDWVDTYLDGD